ncbi:hypothetical protein GcM1_249188 [Golovinomyces cichoracearum]|uniref:Uncharacterized protein n=1 Tax=Golovinomyces cichoracearum TaxID=62708 RepID=A0A420IC23_9PEZI|nr:hypothetical protein GcM1_249188 [Golovinomyces cichoracearum]
MHINSFRLFFLQTYPRQSQVFQLQQTARSLDIYESFLDGDKQAETEDHVRMRTGWTDIFLETDLTELMDNVDNDEYDYDDDGRSRYD